ncbi:hypothetical protein [Bradyrhizobium sp. ARR65]|uniref:hypothetical protein n=1 Tax=Bradyrhizobium sp. ARR65 TaxID=1040989 RepID=UPI000464B419|nr:hypothetical protein [Bradyrhizobium sp. ARR65]
MFEVYLNDKRDLLVLKKGAPIPLMGASGKWRRKKKVLRVSDEIRTEVQERGYYVRKLSQAKLRSTGQALISPSPELAVVAREPHMAEVLRRARDAAQHTELR